MGGDDNMPQYSIVVPVYNSEKTLELLYKRVTEIFEAKYNGDFELVLVDDCSQDHSAEVMRLLREQDLRVKIIFLAKNFGQHRALLCGFHNCKGEYIITMDDDLQHPPEEIPKLIEYMQAHSDVDVVVGNYLVKKHGIVRNMGTKMTNWFTSKIFHKNKNLHLTSFRLIKRYVVEGICDIQVANPRIGHLLLQVTNRIRNVDVRHDSRLYGKSGYSFGRLVRDFTNNILNNSDLPLAILGRLGFFSFIISILMIIYYIARYFIFGLSVQGFTTIVVLLLALGGLILFGIGLIGRYMIQLNSEVKKIPNYVIRSKEVD